MARAAGSARPRAAKPAATGGDVHMLRAVRSTPSKPEVETLCGESGRPYGFDRTGLRTTAWSSQVTCGVCAALPGVAGPVDMPASGGAS